MQADLVGDRDRFTLTSFSAADNAGGSLKARGQRRVERCLPAPTAELSATLANFRVAARDEAVAPRAEPSRSPVRSPAPKITAPLTDRSRRHQPAGQPAAECGRA